jgi:hypothetical protein
MKSSKGLFSATVTLATSNINSSISEPSTGFINDIPPRFSAEVLGEDSPMYVLC